MSDPGIDHWYRPCQNLLCTMHHPRLIVTQEAPKRVHPDGTVCPERPGLPCPVCAMTEAGA